MNNQSVNQESGGNCSHSTLNSGCGCNNASGIVITISPTTGGQFNLLVRITDTVDNLKKTISKKLKVLRERICLLYRDRQLINGSLLENDLNNGSRLTLLPTVETGLTTQRPELSVMNALESLNEAQVNDFLSGKAPLNLTMRLGDHMMLIQLMLSTFSNQNQVAGGGSKTDVPASATQSATTEEKRKEGSSDFAKPSCTTTLSSPRLEKILSSSETSQKNNESLNNYSIVREKNEVTPVSRVFTRSSPMETEISSTLKDQPCPPSSSSSSSCNSNPCLISSKCATDSVPLAKATRNLTQTLQKLSSEVMTSKKVSTVQVDEKVRLQGGENCRKFSGTSSNVVHFSKKPNAILENMEHHGRGIYSGTFSGTLNPALQDRFGRPKKDVSTIIHILNDLLCAEPRSQCRPSCTCRPPSPPIEKMEMSVDESLSTNVKSFEDSVDGSDKMPSIDLASSTLAVAKGCDAMNVQNKQNENQTTRSKMEQLKSIMEERKEKRKEKRFSPYEKRFPSLSLISSSPVSRASTTMHASKSNDSLETESSSLHSKPVIA